MKRYLNLNSDSNVIMYLICSDFIDVQFKNNIIYTYTYISTGQQNIEEMKVLAINGSGLNRYISKHVKDGYSSKRSN